MAWQQAANGRLTVSAGTPWSSTFINFGVGTGVLLIATAIRVVQTGFPTSFPSEWWLYAGGPIGIVFIAANAVVVRSLGVLLQPARASRPAEMASAVPATVVEPIVLLLLGEPAVPAGVQPPNWRLNSVTPLRRPLPASASGWR